MKQHVTVVAALRIGFSALGILVALIVFLAVAGAGLISGDEDAIAITTIVGSAIAFVLILLSVPGIIGGIGLLKRQSWARILVMILAVFDLMNVPIGTAVGVYTLRVLRSLAKCSEPRPRGGFHARAAPETGAGSDSKDFPRALC